MFKHARVFFHLGDARLLRAFALAPDTFPFRPRTRTAPPRVEMPQEKVEMPIAPAMPATIDTGMVNGHRFYQGAWIGHADSNRKPFHVEIVCDGRSRHLQSTRIAIGVGRYADEKPIAEADGLDRSRLFFSSHTPPGRLESLKPKPLTGRCGEIEVTQARSIQILTDEPMTVYADGKPVTRTPATFTFLESP